MLKNRYALECDFYSPDSITCYVNKIYGLPVSYEPENLVVPRVPNDSGEPMEKYHMRMEAAYALEQMFRAANQKDLHPVAVSGYRSYGRQCQIYEANVRKYGVEETNRFSAEPGHSEHQTGLAMDISTVSLGCELEETFAETPEGIWLEKNAHLYGYILRYPKDKSSVTGYMYEPWHVRYVGKGLASLLFCYGITFDELVQEKSD